MAFLAPLAATGAGAAGTAAALGTGAAAAGASTALGAGLSAGTILGTGAASSGILGGLGLNALGGMTSILPASAGLTAAAAPGLAALAPTAGIFAKAAPALGGLSSLAPTAAATPGIFGAASPALGGLSSLTTPLTTASKSLAMANAPLTAGANPATWNAVNQAAGLGNLPAQAGNLGAQLTKVADVAAKTGVDPTKGLIGNAPNISAAPTIQPTPGLTESIRNVNTALRGPVDMSYAANAQGLSPNAAALQQTAASAVDPSKGFLSNAMSLIKNPSLQGAMDYIETHPYASAGAAYGLYNMMKPDYKPPEVDKGTIRPYEYNITQRPEAYAAAPGDSSEQRYFNTEFIELPTYTAKEGGLMSLAVGGPVEQMAELNTVGANTGYPMAHINSPFYANPTMQRPEAVNTLFPSSDAAVGTYTGEAKFAGGGLSDLGDYSDGGRLLKGPGDGVSDSIPASIGNRRPARLADGEFVVPARIVSELGNGSTEAGARKLYAMMDRVQKARRKTVGKKKVAVNSRADKHLPA